MKLFKSNKNKNVFSKVNKAIKNGKVLVLDKKYKSIGITTTLSNIVKSNENYILIVLNNNIKKDVMNTHGLNNNQILTIGSLANTNGAGIETKTLIIDNSIDYKTYRKYISSYKGINTISGVVREDLSHIEEFVF